jgi:NitT/TauT family transport system substrate-binding protein
MIKPLTLAAAFIALGALNAAGKDLDLVRAGTTPSVAQAPLYVAMARGYLAAEGVEVDENNFRGAQDAVSAIATGDLDVNLGAINAGFFNAEQQGIDYRAVASLGIQPLPVTSTPLIARKDLWDSGAIRTGKDLRGRKVAVNTPGASPEYFLSLILFKYGMTLQDVDETMIGFPQMVIALQNKAIEAAFPAEPFASLAIHQGNAELVRPDAGAGGGDMTTVFFFSGKFLRERPDVGVRFLRAVIRGAREVQGDYLKNPEIVAIIAKAIKMAPENISNSVPYQFDPNLDIGKYIDSIKRQEHQHMLDGRLNYAEPLDLSKVVNVELVHRAAAGLKP